MKTMRERWICPNMDVQVFTPQEFVAACESYKEIVITPFNTGCSDGYVECGGKQTDVHFDHSSAITFIPPTSSGTEAVKKFWEDAYTLVSESDDFEVYCKNSSISLGTAKVIGRGNHSITTVETRNISIWRSGFCGMNPSNWGNANATVVLSADWKSLKNHS